MWMDTHSTHNISRSHSVQDVLRSVRMSAVGQTLLETTTHSVSSSYKAWLTIFFVVSVRSANKVVSVSHYLLQIDYNYSFGLCLDQNCCLTLICILETCMVYRQVSVSVYL